jgi:hypothetical protein
VENKIPLSCARGRKKIFAAVENARIIVCDKATGQDERLCMKYFAHRVKRLG